MRRLRNLGKWLIIGVAIAAVHSLLTFVSLGTIAASAVSGEETRIPLVIFLWVFKVCVLPIDLLPVDSSEGWLLLNSALWGFSLAMAARWLLGRRKPVAG